MDKLKYFLLIDPIQTLERGSHNADVEWFIEKFLDEHSIRHERGFALKESNLRKNIAYKVSTTLKLAVTALVNSYKAKRLTRNYDVTVFNPNDDPISLYILQQMRNITSSNFIIKSRFICTRDRVLIKQNSKILNQLKKRIAASIRSEDRTAAETKSYSEFLSSEFRVKVDFVPYPPIDVRFSEEQTPGVSDLYVALGAARKDKGFENLLALIDQISRENPDAHFVIQRAIKKWDGYEEALGALSKLDKVRILPSYIDVKSQHEILTSAFAVLAPYDPIIYQFRGSAFVRRAMYLGKLVCTSPGTSMSKDADSHGLSIFPDSPINYLNTIQARQIRQAGGANLQKESIRVWRSFLL
jgi:hypothetical protein